MTTEGEQQEVVCGTCGGSGRIEIGDTDFGALYDDCRNCNGTGRIPAPVVPSDERCSTCDRREREDCPQCEFDIHREAPGIGACQKHHPFSYPPTPVVPSDERCKVCGETERYPGTDLLRHQHVRPFGEGTDDHDFAPPTPSQDAEGDGRRAWDALTEAARADENAYEYDDDLLTAQEAVESAIRAPYEELVKAAREIVTLGCLCTTEQHHDRCPVVRMKAALESLGGRS